MCKSIQFTMNEEFTETTSSETSVRVEILEWYFGTEISVFPYLIIQLSTLKHQTIQDA